MGFETGPGTNTPRSSNCPRSVEPFAWVRMNTSGSAGSWLMRVGFASMIPRVAVAWPGLARTAASPASSSAAGFSPALSACTAPLGRICSMAWAMRKQCSMCFAADRSAALACRVTSVTKSRLKEICLNAFSTTGVWFFMHSPPIVDGTGGVDHSTRGPDRSTPLGERACPL